MQLAHWLYPTTVWVVDGTYKSWSLVGCKLTYRRRLIACCDGLDHQTSSYENAHSAQVHGSMFAPPVEQIRLLPVANVLKGHCLPLVNGIAREAPLHFIWVGPGRGERPRRARAPVHRWASSPVPFYPPFGVYSLGW
jgi:hypothetical protein